MENKVWSSQPAPVSFLINLVKAYPNALKYEISRQNNSLLFALRQLQNGFPEELVVVMIDEYPNPGKNDGDAEIIADAWESDVQDDILSRLFEKFSMSNGGDKSSNYAEEIVILALTQKRSDGVIMYMIKNYKCSLSPISCIQSLYLALTLKRSDKILYALIDLCYNCSAGQAKNQNSAEGNVVVTAFKYCKSVGLVNRNSAEDNILVTALKYCKSDAVVIYLLESLPVLAALVQRNTKALPIYVGLSCERSLSVIVGLLICCPSSGIFDQTLCNEQIKTDVWIAMTKPLSFWNTYACKFKEGESLSTLIEEVKELIKNETVSEPNASESGIKFSDLRNEWVNVNDNNISRLIDEVSSMKTEMKEIILKGNKQMIMSNSNVLKQIEEIKAIKPTGSMESCDIQAQLRTMKGEILSTIECIQSKMKRFVEIHEVTDQRIDHLQNVVKADLLKLSTEVESKLEAVEVGVSRCLEEYLME